MASFVVAANAAALSNNSGLALAMSLKPSNACVALFVVAPPNSMALRFKKSKSSPDAPVIALKLLATCSKSAILPTILPIPRAAPATAANPKNRFPRPIIALSATFVALVMPFNLRVILSRKPITYSTLSVTGIDFYI